MRRLYRSKRNKVLLGVCGGLSEYLHIDVVTIRIVAVLALFMGWGFIIYIIAAIIMPEEKTQGEGQWGHGHSTADYSSTYSDPGMGTGSDYDAGNDYFSDADSWDRPARYDSDKTKYIIGAILVGVGIMALGRQFMPTLFQFKFMMPLLLIVIGGIILYKGRR